MNFGMSFLATFTRNVQRDEQKSESNIVNSIILFQCVWTFSLTLEKGERMTNVVWL